MDGLEADSKLVLSYFIGGQDRECAARFIGDLKVRLVNRIQLTSDGQKACLEAVEATVGGDLDYARLMNLYGKASGGATGRD